MRSTPRRIGLFGNFGTGNFGNEASLESMIQYLRQTLPDSELTCICPDPEKVQQEHKISTLPIYLQGHPLWRKFANRIHPFRTMRKFDVLIVAGTGILSDFCCRPIDMPYILFKWCLAARLCGTNIAFVSVGAGPIDHPVSRWLMKYAVSVAKYRSYRDKSSKEFLQSLGVNTKNDLIFPDVVFRLRLPPVVTRQFAVRGLTVCLGAIVYNGWRGDLRTDDKIYEEYLERLTEFALWLLNQGCCLRILMGDERDRQAVDDLREAVLAKRRSLPEGALVAESAHSWQDVIRQMGDADLVISSRFHHLVFALQLGKLAMSIGYGNSQPGLMEQMGMGAFCQHSRRIKTELLIAQFTELISNRAHYEAIIVNAVASAQKCLARQDSVFTSQFLQAAYGKHGASIRSGETPAS
jgi:polysaccharide pyruvyl transferase WcaK-like protein